MKKKELQFTAIDYLPFGNCYIHYFVESDHKKAQVFLLGKGYDYEIKGSGLTICPKGKDPIVWIRNRQPHIVAHEMFHAVRHIFKGLGHETITHDNDEIFAYLLDFAIKETLK